MQINKILIVSFLAFFITACYTSNKTTVSSKVAKTLANNEVEAIYLECTVYASTTIFHFKDTIKGDSIDVSVFSEPDTTGVFVPKMPKNMIDDDPNLEGLPGANPKMIGKKFIIIYNNKKEVIEVKSSEK
ncbi:MAG: hypothetical protein SFU27_11920 [Thermonemataceae bacterium]|nr:hypothetical protein [Thermonemataceae bacterium]